VGRKALIVSGTFICAFGTGAISLIPDGAWLVRPAVSPGMRRTSPMVAVDTCRSLRRSPEFVRMSG